jgi:glycosyltransferase involved in cell wall biosynthesis
MARILILISKHLSTAPRAQKEAQALMQLGHDVEIIGTWSDSASVAKDKLLLQQSNLSFKAALDFRPSKPLSNFIARAEHRLAKEVYLKLGLVTPALFGYGARALYRAALKGRFDLVIAHSEVAMWVASKLDYQGLNVGIDMEDWFSRDCEPPVIHRKELEKLERKLLTATKYSTCTTAAMAEALANEYRISKPTVIYNSFPKLDRKTLDQKTLDRRNMAIPSLHWFSQTIGDGRGLETLFEALQAIEQSVELHLRGTLPQGYRKKLEQLINRTPQHTVFFHELVPNTELLSRIAEHDIGLALEEKNVQSGRMTASNKLFQYMLAGIGVIATDTPGQLEVMRSWADEQQIVKQNDVDSLRASIEYYLSQPQALQRIKTLSLDAAEKEYNFEVQLASYRQCIDRALETTDEARSDVRC